jgi:hypothetical protein
MRAEVVLLLGVLIPAVLLAGVDTAWVRRYDGPAHLGADATGLAVDNEGNVIVAGVSLAADSTFDWITIKYLPNGDTDWVRNADFNNGRHKPSGLGVDVQGNVYVTGTNNDSRIVTIKYSPTGNQLWYEFFGSQGGASDLVLDSQGNAIVCGSSYRASADAVTIKYRPNGDTAWVRYYDYAGSDDWADAVAIGESDDLTVAGEGATATTHIDCIAVRYDSTGRQLWAAGYDGPNHGVEVAKDVAVDDSGDAVITGYGDSGYGTPSDYLTIKYGPAGETLWTRRYSGPAGGDDRASAVAVDGGGSVLVTGTAQFETGNRDYATVKYDPGGTQMWVARYDGPAHALDEAHAIAVDSGGSVYVTGDARIQQYVAGCLTIKYNSNADTVWAATYPAPPFTPVSGTAIAVGREGCVYVAGTYDGDVLAIKYVQNGGVTEERATPIASLPSLFAAPSMFSSWNALLLSVGNSATARLLVFDAMGRAVTQAKPGVCFVMEPQAQAQAQAGHRPQAVRKVVLVE